MNGRATEDDPRRHIWDKIEDIGRKYLVTQTGFGRRSPDLGEIEDFVEAVVELHDMWQDLPGEDE